ncbi:hypothetical protein [Streptomyces sp. LaBMicrA B280]|uniref:hypothetical protein n=1 Tax=Streptomyces sp. LaBMicrA B280 TaxID=3391001 RepID=UPI003BA7072A
MGDSVDLRRGIGALTKLKGGFDEALKTLEGSSGGTSDLAQHTLERTSFSGTNIPFAEATGLHQQYQAVHDRIMSMSKTLGLQIEAMTVAMQSADGTYDGTEEDARRRFWQIKTQLDKEYQKTHPAHEKHEQPGKGTQRHDQSKSVGDGF